MISSLMHSEVREIQELRTWTMVAVEVSATLHPPHTMLLDTVLGEVSQLGELSVTQRTLTDHLPHVVHVSRLVDRSLVP